MVPPTKPEKIENAAKFLRLITPAIKDKSVDTFKQNKRFLSAPFRNFKNRAFLIA